jgi:hypothetical protein
VEYRTGRWRSKGKARMNEVRVSNGKDETATGRAAALVMLK